MADIVLFGAGDIADVASVYIERHSNDRLVGYTVDGAFRQADTFRGKPLVDWETLERDFPPDAVQLLGPLSYRGLNALRRDRYLEGKARGYGFARFVHPASHVYADVGENSFILEQNVIQPFVTLGVGLMMWSGNHVGHHATVGDHCFFSSHVGITSNVTIGERCFFGGRSGVRGGVRIGDRCFVGEACVVGEDAPDGSVFLEKPTRRSRHDSERIARIL